MCTCIKYINIYFENIIYKQYIIIFKTQTVNSGLLIEAFSPLTFKVIDIFKVNN